MSNFSHVPPGFRFHPTDEELVDYYLRKKIASKRIDLNVIKDVDLYKIEPWDLQEICKIGSEEQSDWYFFSHKDKKYPTGTRTNRATRAGFWKATGRDKAIYTKNCLVGMRKTLVFYKGRAPNGQKSDWIMHEYRLETNENNGNVSQEEGWVVCRVFKKRITTVRREGECWYDDQVLPTYFDSSPRPPYTSPHHHHHHHHLYSCKQELDHHMPNNNYTMPLHNHHHHHQQHHDNNAFFLQLPQLESPKVTQSSTSGISSSSASGVHHPFPTAASSLSSMEEHLQQVMNPLYSNINGGGGVNDQVATTDWRVLDKFVASQLMSHHQDNNVGINSAHHHHDDKEEGDEDLNLLLNDHIDHPSNNNKTHEMASELASITTTSSSSQVDMWK